MESGPHKVTLTLGINNNNNTPSLVNNAGQRRETRTDHLEQHTWWYRDFTHSGHRIEKVFCLFISPWWECVSPHPTPHNILTTSLILRQDKPQRHSTQAIVNINEALMKHFWSELKTFYMTMTPGTKRTLIRSWGYNQCSMKFNLRISMMDQNAPIPFNLKLLTLNWASSTWFNFSNA